MDKKASHFKNIYVIDKTTQKWVSLDKTTLYVYWNVFNGETAGTCDYGFTSNYFYMSSGLPVDDQKEYVVSSVLVILTFLIQLYSGEL